jgi:Holliday junction resolvase
MAITPEGRVKAKVKALLNKHNIYHFMPATGGYGRSGIPDIIGCYNGYFFAIECKAGNNKPTALQLRELDNIAKAGGDIFIVNENNVHQLENFLITDRDNLTSSKEEE